MCTIHCELASLCIPRKSLVGRLSLKGRICASILPWAACVQEALKCVAPRFLWSSVYGVYGNETGTDDAFATLLTALARQVKDMVS